ncbi:conserved domain-containing protein [Quadrisphaera granulorum]|uniref:Uncharacterized protein (TIGR02271 family) n=1 Tax=Quadrisphaera granulorum TaxID=317664 RepID=A0A316A809_9ACTN|nr:PRC and DUF2382 domain-containing protein [Quadrisphaera granulorum]PWJ53845.1 uncharacterized protein (TIGR02271 family) [Quadrisphaera granulorum]SZE96602.1 conserved domain-containing protein [Quadrisphaera granulorum]
MASGSSFDVDTLRRATVVASDSSKIGRVGEVYLDDATDKPEWVTVRTGLFGTSETFVPLAGATSEGDDLRVPHTKDVVKDAPRTDADGELTPEEEQRLYRHYGMADDTTARTTAETTAETTAGTTGAEHLRGEGAGYADGSGQHRGEYEGLDELGAAQGTAGTGTGTARDTGAGIGTTGPRSARGHDTSGPSTDDAMTRSEERMHVATERRESGRARLRKHVVTETQTRQVPTSHEEVTLEREPITAGNRESATSGPELSEEEHEVVLHEEVPVVSTTVEPVERVRVGTEEVREERPVSADVRKEEIDLDADAPRAEAGRADTRRDRR